MNNSQSVCLVWFLFLSLFGVMHSANACTDAESANCHLKPWWKGVRLGAGYLYDDNLTRAELDSDKKASGILSLQLSNAWPISVGTNSRVVMTGNVGAQEVVEYQRLSLLSAGAQAEFQYRPSASFDAPTLGAFFKLTGEEFASKMRDNFRYQAGFNVRQRLTDKLQWSGMLGYQVRDSQARVFDTQEAMARLHLDYRLVQGGSFYLSSEWRHGDVFTTATPSPKNGALGAVIEQDDVFTSSGMRDYRFLGDTQIVNIGYNHPLSANSALDVSWRWIESSPDREPSFASGTTHYRVNQLGASYLVRF